MGCAKDIAIGASGDVWALGCFSAYGGWTIYRWNGTTWDQAEGLAVRIGVGPQRNPVIILPTGGVVRSTDTAPAPGTWDDPLPSLGTLPDALTDIYVDPNGATYIVGADVRFRLEFK